MSASGPGPERSGDAPNAAAERHAGGTPPVDIRIALPEHLRNLAQVGREVRVRVPEPVTLGAALDALEASYPVLKGAIRQHGSLERRAFVRFFAVGADLSHDPPDTVLPAPVVSGHEPLVVVGAMAGG
jgi:sulfur-carrier protein